MESVVCFMFASSLTWDMCCPEITRSQGTGHLDHKQDHFCLCHESTWSGVQISGWITWRLEKKACVKFHYDACGPDMVEEFIHVFFSMHPSAANCMGQVIWKRIQKNTIKWRHWPLRNTLFSWRLPVQGTHLRPSSELPQNFTSVQQPEKESICDIQLHNLSGTGLSATNTNQRFAMVFYTFKG